MIRAKNGLQAGDTQKAAHMAYYLAYMNETEKRYEDALKYYKNYFINAKIMQDLYGTEVALNRIAVVYSDIGDYGAYLI